MNFKNTIEKMVNRRPWETYYQKDRRNINIPNLSVYEYLLDNNKDNKLEIALNYFNKKMTFDELFKNINICAKAFRSVGIREGDVVTICMPNTPEAVISFYAVNKIGAIANMLHPLSAEEEIKNSLISTKSVMLIAVNLSYSKVKNIVDETNVYKTVIVSAADSMPKFLGLGYYLTQGRKIEKPRRSELYLFWHNFMSRGKKYNGKVLIKTTDNQPAVILHSGGTTGTPKNIVLTNGNLNALVEQAKIVFPKISVGDSVLTVLPLFHCFGLVVSMHAILCLKASCILVPQFDAKRFDKLFKYKPTILTGVPTLYEALLTNKYMNNIDLQNIKYVISGGDSLSPQKNEMINNFLKRHGSNATVIQGYGMTETCGPVCAGVLGSDALGSIGIPLPGNFIKIIDVDTREEKPYGEIGEILINSPTTMMGYLNNEKETNDILELDKKGKIWVHTGDMGYMTKEGIVYYVQRLKRMLIVSGYNVYPSHIENVLLEHPAILNCGVVGVPHPYKVQVPKAYIVLENGYKVNGKIKREIKDYCEKHLAHYMIPKEFEFRESLPKTLIGKVNYRELENEKNK